MRIVSTREGETQPAKVKPRSFTTEVSGAGQARVPLTPTAAAPVRVCPRYRPEVCCPSSPNLGPAERRAAQARRPTAMPPKAQKATATTYPADPKRGAAAMPIDAAQAGTSIASIGAALAAELATRAGEKALKIANRASRPRKENAHPTRRKARKASSATVVHARLAPALGKTRADNGEI